jgi:hypothetical protein
MNTIAISEEVKNNLLKLLDQETISLDTNSLLKNIELLSFHQTLLMAKKETQFI